MTVSKTRTRNAAADKCLETVLAAVDAERTNLGRVIALLQCLTVALEQQAEDFPSGPYYAGVPQIAIDIIAKSVDALDHFNLPGGRSDLSP